MISKNKKKKTEILNLINDTKNPKPIINQKSKLNLQMKYVYKFLSKLDFEQQKFFKNLLEQKIKRIIYERNKLKFKDQYPINVKKKSYLSIHKLNLKFNNYYLYSYLPNSLFLKKLSNILMIHGVKSIAMKILIKFFEILKLKFNIGDPIRKLRKLIYINLVPVIKSKTIGFKVKKVIGLTVPIYKRINNSIKLYIKGARSHNVPIVFGLIIEFFNLIKNESFLQSYNIKLLNEIETLSLYKYLNITKTQALKTTNVFYEKSLINLNDLLNIDWNYVNKLRDNFTDSLLNRQLQKQQYILFKLKNIIFTNNIDVPENIKFNIFKEEIRKRHELHINENVLFDLFKFNNPNKIDIHINIFKFSDILTADEISSFDFNYEDDLTKYKN